MNFHITTSGNGYTIVESDTDYHGSVERVFPSGYYRATYSNDSGIQSMLFDDPDDAVAYITDLATAEYAA